MLSSAAGLSLHFQGAPSRARQQPACSRLHRNGPCIRQKIAPLTLCCQAGGGEGAASTSYVAHGAPATAAVNRRRLITGAAVLAACTCSGCLGRLLPASAEPFEPAFTYGERAQQLLAWALALSWFCPRGQPPTPFQAMPTTSTSNLCRGRRSQPVGRNLLCWYRTIPRGPTQHQP